MGELRCVACQTPLNASTPFCPHCGATLAAEKFEVGALVDGRYRIVSLLGEGAMSAVYLARHERLDREVALKTLRSLHASDPTAVQRFGREARVVAGLSHPNIVQVFDFGVGMDGSPFLVMERIDGTTLEDELDRNRAFTIERAAHVLAQVASALAEAHANDLVHRDLKPGNVMLSPRGPDVDFVKVVDFGLAQRIGIDPRITQSGGIVGTPFYLAPEAWAGKVDARTDIYAFGVLTYELVTGERPFTANTPTALLIEHMEGRPKLPGEIAPALSLFDELVMACLAKDPSERPKSGAELLEPIRKLLRVTPSPRRRTTYAAALTSPRTPDPTLYDARHRLDAYWDGPSLAIEVTTLHAARRRRLRELMDLVWTDGVPQVIAELAAQVGELDSRAEEIGQSAAALDAAIRDREHDLAREEAALRQRLFDASLALTAARDDFDDGDGPTLQFKASPFDTETATAPDGVAARAKEDEPPDTVARLEEEIAAFQRGRAETERDDRKNMERLVARLEAVEEELKAPAEKLWSQIVAATRKRPDLRPALLELGKVDGAIASYRALVSAAVAGSD